MRIVVLSDTHRDFFTALEIVKRHLHDADVFLHLGDGLKEWDDLRALYPDKRMLAVRGNCDFASDEPSTAVLACEDGHKVFYTHGHLYHVKSAPDELIRAARENGCDIALHGHTHTARQLYEDGLFLLCPGSPSCPKDSSPGYGIVDITPAGVAVNKVEWRP